LQKPKRLASARFGTEFRLSPPLKLWRSGHSGRGNVIFALAFRGKDLQ
jgi:hypothetical protein